MTVDQLDPTPIYEQLARIIRERIKAGDLKERQTVPSETSLQQEHGIARGSVRRAMELLREEGWVVTIQGRGTFVAPRDRWPYDPSREPRT
ncbi:GntR family transcriptional regulator [Nonomuraea wenchangensis]